MRGRKAEGAEGGRRGSWQLYPTALSLGEGTGQVYLNRSPPRRHQQLRMSLRWRGSLLDTLHKMQLHRLGTSLQQSSPANAAVCSCPATLNPMSPAEPRYLRFVSQPRDATSRAPAVAGQNQFRRGVQSTWLQLPFVYFSCPATRLFLHSRFHRKKVKRRHSGIAALDRQLYRLGRGLFRCCDPTLSSPSRYFPKPGSVLHQNGFWTNTNTSKKEDALWHTLPLCTTPIISVMSQDTGLWSVRRPREVSLKSSSSLGPHHHHRNRLADTPLVSVRCRRSEASTPILGSQPQGRL